MRTATKQIASLLKVVMPATRTAIGVIFIWASIQKIQHPYLFLSAVQDYQIVGAKLAMLTAMTIPWIELFLGGLLISGAYQGGALLAASALTAVFVFVQSSAMARGLTISCGCFGSDAPELVGFGTIARTMLLLAASLAAFAWPLFFRRGSAPDGPVAPA
jgi:hypothetical protein